jgi:hypothetical protein
LFQQRRPVEGQERADAPEAEATSESPKARRRPIACNRSGGVSIGRATIRRRGWAVTFLNTHSVPAPKVMNPRTRRSTPTRRRPCNSASRRSAAVRNSLGSRGAAAARAARCSRSLAVRAAIASENVGVAGSAVTGVGAGWCCASIHPRTAGSCSSWRSCCTCRRGRVVRRRGLRFGGCNPHEHNERQRQAEEEPCRCISV